MLPSGFGSLAFDWSNITPIIALWQGIFSTIGSLS